MYKKHVDSNDLIICNIHDYESDEDWIIELNNKIIYSSYNSKGFCIKSQDKQEIKSPINFENTEILEMATTSDKTGFVVTQYSDDSIVKGSGFVFEKTFEISAAATLNEPQPMNAAASTPRNI